MAVQYTETLNTILKDTIPQLPGVVRAVAERELRMTFREFFERSFAWRENIPNVDIPVGETVIDVNAAAADPNADVIAVMEIGYAKRRQLGKLPTRPLGEEVGNEQLFYYNDCGTYDQIVCYPYSDVIQTNALDIVVAKTPKLTATVFPRELQTKYYDALIDGFLARMYMHPNKPYSQPQLGMAMRHSFRRKIGYYNAQAKQGYNDSQSWRFPASGWGVRRLTRNG